MICVSVSLFLYAAGMLLVAGGVYERDPDLPGLIVFLAALLWPLVVVLLLIELAVTKGNPRD